jgi:hypothetical protein
MSQDLVRNVGSVTSHAECPMRVSKPARTTSQASSSTGAPKRTYSPQCLEEVVFSEAREERQEVLEGLAFP